MSVNQIGSILVVVSAAFYGLQPLFAFSLYDLGMTPLSVFVLRFGIAALMMMVFLLLTGRKILPGFSWTSLAFGVCMAGAALGYYTAGQRLGFNLAVMLLFSFPVFVTLFIAFQTRSAPTGFRLIALVCGLLGTWIIIGSGDLSGDPLGYALGLGAACSYGIAMIISARRKVDDAWVDVFWVAIGAFTILAVYAASSGQIVLITMNSIALGAGLAFSATIMATGLLLMGIDKVGPSDAATLALSEAFFATALSTLFLGDQLTLALIMGGALIMASAVIISRQKAPVS